MNLFNSDDHYIYYCRQESLRRKGVVIMVNKRVRNAVLGCNLKNDRMISVRFQGKPLNITVIQVYAPTSNAEEAEVERFYEDLHPGERGRLSCCIWNLGFFPCIVRKKTPGSKYSTTSGVPCLNPRRGLTLLSPVCRDPAIGV